MTQTPPLPNQGRFLGHQIVSLETHSVASAGSFYLSLQVASAVALWEEAGGQPCSLILRGVGVFAASL